MSSGYYGIAVNRKSFDAHRSRASHLFVGVLQQTEAMLEVADLGPERREPDVGNADFGSSIERMATGARRPKRGPQQEHDWYKRERHKLE